MEEAPLSQEDKKITDENVKLLSLTEHPVWGTFVRMVSDDLNALDSISSLDLSKDVNRDELVREVEVRYHTIEAVKSYLGRTIERANLAQEDIEEAKSDIIKFHN